MKFSGSLALKTGTIIDASRQMVWFVPANHPKNSFSDPGLGEASLEVGGITERLHGDDSLHFYAGRPIVRGVRFVLSQK